MLRALVQGAGAGFTLSGLSSTFLDGQGNFSIPPYPVGAGSGTVTSVDLTGPVVEFFSSGGPVTASGTLNFDWKAPTLVAHGGTGMGSFAPNSILRAGLGSSAKFQSTPLNNLSSNFLDGTGNWAIPPLPAGGAGTVTQVDTGAGLTGGPITTAGAVGLVMPVAVSSGGTGMGSFLANSILTAGLTSTGKFQSLPLPGLSSTFLSGAGTFIFPTAIKTYQLEFLIGDATNVIGLAGKPTGVVRVPRAGTITGWQILSCDSGNPTSGSIVLDLFKDTYANYPPTAADSIVGGAFPSVTSATKNLSSAPISNWTLGLLEGDILYPSVQSVTSLKAVKLIITYLGF